MRTHAVVISLALVVGSAGCGDDSPVDADRVRDSGLSRGDAQAAGAGAGGADGRDSGTSGRAGDGDAGDRGGGSGGTAGDIGLTAGTGGISAGTGGAGGAGGPRAGMDGGDAEVPPDAEPPDADSGMCDGGVGREICSLVRADEDCDGRTDEREADGIYSVYSTTDASTGNVEWRACRAGHHFLSVIRTLDGAVAYRPHPGVDRNGWGSTAYLNAYVFSDASGAPVKPREGDVTLVEVGVDGVHVEGNGPVNTATGAYGTWQAAITFQYDSAAKTITGAGTYDVALGGALAGVGDLNLAATSSNFLSQIDPMSGLPQGVPLLDGSIGFTGDVASVEIAGNDFTFTWVPPVQPAFYPTDTTARLSFDLVGQYNQIDAEMLGLTTRIEPAYKPSLRISLDTGGSPLLTFGAQYDQAYAVDPFADNIGVVALVQDDASDTTLSIAIAIESSAVPGDGT